MTTKRKLTQEEVLNTKGCKFTLISLGGGFMNGDAISPVKHLGMFPRKDGSLVPAGTQKLKGRKPQVDILRALAKNAIVLEGVENPVKMLVCQSGSFIIDGRGGRFLNDGENGDTILREIRERLVFHTVGDDVDIRLVAPGSDDTNVSADFGRRLRAVLGEPAVIEAAPPKPVRKELLTARMKEELVTVAAASPPRPLYKIFDPSGAGTWLLCSMEDDGDTLWVVADIGFGCVEYGTHSLRELEETKGRFGLGMERDLHFEGKALDFAELLTRDSLSGV